MQVLNWTLKKREDVTRCTGGRKVVQEMGSERSRHRHRTFTKSGGLRDECKIILVKNNIHWCGETRLDTAVHKFMFLSWRNLKHKGLFIRKSQQGMLFKWENSIIYKLLLKNHIFIWFFTSRYDLIVWTQYPPTGLSHSGARAQEREPRPVSQTLGSRTAPEPAHRTALAKSGKVL